MRYRLVARVSSDSPASLRAALGQWLGTGGSLRPTADGFELEAEVEGESARDLNRDLLSTLRRVEKKTRLRAEWTAGGTVEKFFDYVPKGTRPVTPEA